MNCPYCGFRFKMLVFGGGESLPRLAPLVCESCAEVSLLRDGVTWRLQPGELEALKKSPAWESFIAPALEIINAERGKRS